MLDATGSSTGTAANMSSDLVNFAAFMRLSRPAHTGGHVRFCQQRRSPVQRCRLRALPLGDADYRDVEVCRYVEHHLSPIL